MLVNNDKNRILIGLKIKYLRLEQKLSTQQLSKLSFLSPSYLNEIEKGKKFPSNEKQVAIANALKVDPKLLFSEIVNHKLLAIKTLLDSNFLKDVPFDFFGIDYGAVFEMLAGSPVHFSTFINSISRIGSSYNLDVQHFYFAILKSYQEVHFNHFDAIEFEIEEFLRTYSTQKINDAFLGELLSKKYGIQIQFFESEKTQTLQSLRSNFIEKRQTLWVNKNLSKKQKTFVLARELAFKHLKLQKRPYTYNYVKVNSFEEILNNFKASYFGGGILVSKNEFKPNISNFLENLDADFIKIQTGLFDVTAETLLQRMVSILSNDFGIKKTAFFKFESTRSNPKPMMIKDFRLGGKHMPNETKTENYCDLWTPISSLEKIRLQKTTNGFFETYQISNYQDAGKRYLDICVASKTKNVSHTICVCIEICKENSINEEVLNQVEEIMVGHTCERCSLFDCKERKASPSVFQKQRLDKEFNDEFQKFFR